MPIVISIQVPLDASGQAGSLLQGSVPAAWFRVEVEALAVPAQP